MAFMMSTSRER